MGVCSGTVINLSQENIRKESAARGKGIMYTQATSRDMYKKVCNLTGPATSTRCGKIGYFGHLNKFASPLMGLITDKCR
jgi:hypothetical protein